MPLIIDEVVQQFHLKESQRISKNLKESQRISKNLDIVSSNSQIRVDVITEQSEIHLIFLKQLLHFGFAELLEVGLGHLRRCPSQRHVLPRRPFLQPQTPEQEQQILTERFKANDQVVIDQARRAEEVERNPVIVGVQRQVSIDEIVDKLFEAGFHSAGVGLTILGHYLAPVLSIIVECAVLRPALVILQFVTVSR